MPVPSGSVWAGDVDFYQKILVGQGAFAAYLPAREGEAYTASDDYFGGQAVWVDFSDWQAQIPGVTYGIFTNEADAAVTAALPGLVAGGSIDEPIAAIDAQIAQQIQHRFGFRSAVFTPEGFQLNGRSVKIRGLNRHQSFPYQGYALGRAAQERDAEIL